MDDKTLRRIIEGVVNGGPYVLTPDGIVRQKNMPRKALKMRKSTLMGAIASGHLEVADGHVRATPKSRRMLANERSRSAEYSSRMRDRGCVRKSLWVHPDDVARFEEFVTTLKGPSS